MNSNTKLEKYIKKLTKLYLHEKHKNQGNSLIGGATTTRNSDLYRLNQDIRKKGYMTLDDAINNIYLRVNKNI